MAMMNIHPKLYFHCIPSLLILVSLEESVHLLSVLHIDTKILPSRHVDEVIIMCILGEVYCVITPHQ